MIPDIETITICRNDRGYCTSLNGCILTKTPPYEHLFYGRVECEFYHRKHPLYGYYYEDRPISQPNNNPQQGE